MAESTGRESRRIVFWRHGRTTWNAEQRFQGQTDIELDETGVAQAVRAAGMLASLNPTRLVSSDLVRARATAEPLSRLTGLPIITDPGLRETYAGEWEGLTRPELERRFGDGLAKWSSDPTYRAGNTGETRIEVARRVAVVVQRELDAVQPGGVLVVATHGGAARAGIGEILGLPPEHWGVLGVLTNTSWSVLVENVSGHGSPWRLQEYNAGTLPEAALADDR